ncbi:rna-directed dna polymerase from mobile element jockey-like [Limosa lapponica baueri]|uniref:Rna-directed dna polymerase from mobile element jockey-like n=1 Tax=Limosa lapponica baueri TaxID=1758121 RepID=A0A2I0UGZ1_LIMLA|nr:rna-directed dna polymerase from mobile element jockey-like [Limosa lapponica baueri]
MSKWQAVMSSVPKRSVLGPVLFNIFVNNMDSRSKCTLSKFANDTKLCGAIDTLEGKDVIQRDQGRLESWARANLMKFIQAKYKVLHMASHVSRVILGLCPVASQMQERHSPFLQIGFATVTAPSVLKIFAYEFTAVYAGTISLPVG